MNSYTHYEDFHSDMLLVRDNCRRYNPPGSVVRRDCDEVFAFYMSEYEKLLEKWQKVICTCIYHDRNLQFLNHVIIKTKVLLPPRHR